MDSRALWKALQQLTHITSTLYQRSTWPYMAIALPLLWFGVRPANAVTVNIITNSEETIVCPAIYGINFPDHNAELANAVGFTHARWGGNRATRYNYSTHTSCSGMDYSEDANGTACNRPPDNSSCFETCERYLGRHEDFIVNNSTRGKLVDIPANRFDSTAPAGSKLKATLSSALAGSKCWNHLNNADCDQEYGQSAFDGFVADLLSRNVREFEIDNEPTLWHETHNVAATPPLRPVVNGSTSVAQANANLMQMQREAAQRIAQIATGAPHSLVPGSFKIWAGAFYSGWDLSGGYTAGNFPTCNSSSCFTYAFMQSLCDTPATGISFHWYPEITANGCRIQNGQCPDSAGVTWGRVNASRELWQAGFTASNAAKGVVSSYNAPHVIPWLKQINAAACPSKPFEFAITEWRLAQSEIAGMWSAGLGTLDFLAGMARAGVAEAHLWSEPRVGNTEQAVYLAFQLLRAPNGSTASAVGGPDGGIMVSTDRITDESLRAYAYKSSNGVALWVLLLNLDHTANTKSVTVQLNDASATGTAAVYGLDRSGSALVRSLSSSIPVNGSSFTLSVPSGARLVHLPNITGARVVAHEGCGAVSTGTPPPPLPPPGIWTATATHVPSTPVAGQSVTARGTVQHTHAGAQTINVQTMVKNAANAIIGSTNCTNVTVQPNTPYSCNHVATYSAGNYKTEIGIFSPDWATVHSWTADADSFSVTAPPTNLSVRSGAIVETSSCSGQALHVSGDVVGGSAAGTYNIQLMLKDASGANRGIWNCIDVPIAAGQANTCSGTITSTAAGSLSLSAGIFNEAFNSQLDWRDGLDTVIQSSCAPSVYYGFEGSVEGWQITSGQAAVFESFSNSPAFGHGGAYALRVQSYDAATVQIASKETAPLPAQGDTVSFFIAASNPACVDFMQPYIQFGSTGGWSWKGIYVAGAQIPIVSNDQWLEVRVPIDNGAGQVWRIGAEAKLKAGCTYSSVYIDDVSW
jgi:hypothetical protein